MAETTKKRADRASVMFNKGKEVTKKEKAPLAEAGRASVVFNRQAAQDAKKKLEDAKKAEKKASGGGGCCDGCFSFLMPPPPRERKSTSGGEYGDPQDLEPMPLCVKWANLEAARKTKVKFVEIISAQKEGVSGWQNQDATSACAPPGDDQRTLIFCVFDGHGSNGHDVSGIAADRLPAHLAAFPGGALSSPKAALEEAFKKTDDDIWKAMGEAVEYSGTTGVAVLMDADRRVLHVGNVGDSRAVLGQVNGSDVRALPLTEDLKPALPEERLRIEGAGGVVQPMSVDNQDVGVDRVWDSVARQKPGLAVSRSLGDGASRSLGVIAEPVVTMHQLGPQDKFMMLASDGLWDSLGNDQAVQMASKYLDRNLPNVALKAMTEAVRREEGGELADDTTTVLVVF